MKRKNFLFPLFLLFALVLLFVGVKFLSEGGLYLKPKVTPEDITKGYEEPSVTPTATPTPKPLTFAEMNALYGPCVHLPVLMYHHIQPAEVAKDKKQTSLTVTPEYFRAHLEYLKLKGYQTIYMSELVNFFDQGTPVPVKSILITFDDGYDDFSTYALPILRELGFKATVFLPTGLMDNPGYLSWQTILDIAGKGDIMFSNHTWSHRNMGSDKEAIQREINLADVQLNEKGLNSPKIFAYPYGLESAFAKEVMSGVDYKLAFSTKPGSTQCKVLRYDLQRIRIGNTDLANYGF
jgi:peptidoglycan/xylan/chitin deacetylase (PgdA/CDA1 family)